MRSANILVQGASDSQRGEDLGEWPHLDRSGAIGIRCESVQEHNEVEYRPSE